MTDIQQIAAAVAEMATMHKRVNSLASQVLANNSAKSINWEDLPAGSVDEDGNVDGTTYTPAEISNVIGSLSTYQTAHWDAGHGGNYEKLSKPIV